MTASPQLATIRDTGKGGATFTATFNPASLKITITNKIQDEEDGKAGGKGGKGSKGQARQNTRVTTTKLDTELIFDTTESGADVRDGAGGTAALKALGSAPESEHPAQPTVEFRWGRFSFVGLIETLEETLDFWSAEGVPLRSTVKLAMQGTRVDKIEKGGGAALPEPQKQTISQAPAGGRGATDVGARHGAPGAGRAIAARNGVENMRMTGGGAVAVAASIQLKAAAAFSLGAAAGASASASAGASAGFGAGAAASAGVSAGVAAGASAGFGASASAGFAAGASAGFGARATAGVSASAGAFAGLGASKTASVGLPFDPARLLPKPPIPAAGPGARFDVTGKAATSGPPGLSAQVSGQAFAGVRFG